MGYQGAHTGSKMPTLLSDKGNEQNHARPRRPRGPHGGRSPGTHHNPPLPPPHTGQRRRHTERGATGSPPHPGLGSPPPAPGPPLPPPPPPLPPPRLSRRGARSPGGCAQARGEARRRAAVWAAGRAVGGGDGASYRSRAAVGWGARRRRPPSASPTGRAGREAAPRVPPSSSPPPLDAGRRQRCAARNRGVRWRA